MRRGARNRFGLDPAADRAWLDEMFAAIEAFSRSSRSDLARRKDGEFLVQLVGTWFRLEYQDGLRRIDIALADLEVGGGDRQPRAGIAAWILQVRQRILRAAPRR